MKFGLFGINTGILQRPETIARVARAAEAAGFESVWAPEHIVLPDPQVPPSPVPADTFLLDPSAALAFVAAHTERIRLGTGIIILPQRNPVELAKELASVDVLSDGRLIFGLGVGYLESEYAALGMNFHDRGARADEYIDVLRALWTQESPAFSGRTVRFSGIDAQPRPVQRPHPPIVVGGQSPAAFRRAVARGNGWYGPATPDTLPAVLEQIERAREEVDRPAELGDLEIGIMGMMDIDLEAALRYADLGVDRLTVLTQGETEAEVIRAIEERGETIVRKLA
ncbi:MAG: LLM class F420-dependent oxidoreductase [Deltaproteobacteria bacterium]|nr:LLM class F420-dependent oxidoreductase [Deltaproteobacteria bacterium]